MWAFHSMHWYDHKWINEWMFPVYEILILNSKLSDKYIWGVRRGWLCLWGGGKAASWLLYLQVWSQSAVWDSHYELESPASHLGGGPPGWRRPRPRSVCLCWPPSGDCAGGGGASGPGHRPPHCRHSRQVPWPAEEPGEGSGRGQTRRVLLLTHCTAGVVQQGPRRPEDDGRLPDQLSRPQGERQAQGETSGHRRLPSDLQNKSLLQTELCLELQRRAGILWGPLCQAHPGRGGDPSQLRGAFIVQSGQAETAYG